MKTPSRREFCAGCAAGSLALTVTGCGGVQTLRPRPIKAGPVTIPLSDVQAALLEQPAVLIDPGLQREVMILRGSAPEFQALSAVCTHLGCMVRPMKEAIVCPCHGATFALDGKVTRGPAKKDLRRFPVQVEGTNVIITV